MKIETVKDAREAISKALKKEKLDDKLETSDVKIVWKDMTLNDIKTEMLGEVRWEFSTQSKNVIPGNKFERWLNGSSKFDKCILIVNIENGKETDCYGITDVSAKLDDKTINVKLDCGKVSLNMIF